MEENNKASVLPRFPSQFFGSEILSKQSSLLWELKSNAAVEPPEQELSVNVCGKWSKTNTRLQFKVAKASEINDILRTWDKSE